MDAGHGDERNAAIQALVEDVHRLVAPVMPFTPGSDELLLPAAWRAGSADPELLPLVDDFNGCLAKLWPNESPSANPARITFARAPGRAAVEVTDAGVTLTGENFRELWRASVWAQQQMTYRHAPILPRGRAVIQTTYDRRITASMFAQGLERAADPLAYTDGYLCSLAHLGYTQLFLYINLWEHCTSDLLPQMADAQAPRRLTEMAQLARRAERYGVELQLLVAAPRLFADHPVFAAFPQLKGGNVMRAAGHALCTSCPLTHDFYAEQMSRLAQQIPNLGALGFLIGGEGFLHCYTRPVPRTERVTNCPTCGQRRPSEVLAPLLNRLIAAVKQVNPTTRLLFWPYSSYIWTPHKPVDCDWAEDLNLARLLDPRGSLVLEIDKDAVTHVDGVGRVSVGDYSIQQLEPSQRFKHLTPVLRERGVELVIKSEICIDAHFHSVPYIPVMQRWATRLKTMQAQGAKVAWESWRFIGAWSAPSVLMAYWVDAQPALSSEQLVARVAQTLYGPAGAPHAVAAWERFSAAWDTMHRLYGPYWQGPLVIGPAHPFDMGAGFLFRNSYGPGFYDIMPGMRESENAAYLSNPRNEAARFCFTPLPPYGPRLRDHTTALERFHAGLPLLQQALDAAPPALQPIAQLDHDIAWTNALILEEDVAFARWVKLRDELWYLDQDDPQHRAHVEAMLPILREAIHRARHMLTLMARQPFLGWGYTFSVRFTQAMVAEKLSKTQALLGQLEATLG